MTRKIVLPPFEVVDVNPNGDVFLRHTQPNPDVPYVYLTTNGPLPDWLKGRPVVVTLEIDMPDAPALAVVPAPAETDATPAPEA